MRLLFYTKLGLVLSVLSILAGAFVRATGSGDGCGATWPTCKGKIIPTLSDTSEIIEFSHRSVSGVLLIVTLYIFINSRKLEKNSIARTAVNYLTFFVLFEALIGAVIVVFEWVGLNSSLPRIIAVPIHLVNTFGLLASYVILYKILENKLDSIKNLWDRNFVIISILFELSPLFIKPPIFQLYIPCSWPLERCSIVCMDALNVFTALEPAFINLA